MTAFLHGQIKIFIFSEKRFGIKITNILRMSNSKTISKVKRHLLTSQKGNDVTILALRAKHRQRDDNSTGSTLKQSSSRVV